VVEGWKCPECGRINNPLLDHCLCKDNKITYIPVIPYISPYPIYPDSWKWPYGYYKVTCDTIGNSSTYKIECGNNMDKK
jgi:hypothetical protein